MAWVSLCEVGEVPSDSGKYVEIDGFKLAVFVQDGKPYVMDDMCPHAGGNMSGGYVDEGCAVCPWHGWSFHLETGGLRNAPRVTIPTYPVRVLKREGHPDLIQAELPTP
jgi:nitrite reductase/ring-hydroxylating ferredoxin subunit